MAHQNTKLHHLWLLLKSYYLIHHDSIKKSFWLIIDKWKLTWVYKVSIIYWLGENVTDTKNCVPIYPSGVPIYPMSQITPFLTLPDTRVMGPIFVTPR